MVSSGASLTISSIKTANVVAPSGTDLHIVPADGRSVTIDGDAVFNGSVSGSGLPAGPTTQWLAVNSSFPGYNGTTKRLNLNATPGPYMNATFTMGTNVEIDSLVLPLLASSDVGMLTLINDTPYAMTLVAAGTNYIDGRGIQTLAGWQMAFCVVMAPGMWRIGGLTNT